MKINLNKLRNETSCDAISKVLEVMATGWGYDRR